MVNEIKDFIRFMKRKDKSVVFYAEDRNYDIDFEGFTGDYLFAYVTSDNMDSMLGLDNAYYSKRFLPFIMGTLDTKVCLMTMPDLGNYHIKRSRLNPHYIYTFHSLASTHMGYNERAFDNYDSIFCCGQYHVDEIRQREKIYGLKPKKLVEVGNLRLENFHRAYQSVEKNGESSVLVAPSWYSGNIFESCGFFLIESLLSGGYKVILRPHWETMRRNKRLLADYDGLYEDKVIWDCSNAVSGEWLKADYLITDWSGISFEWAFATERPVIFIDTPMVVRNPNWHELGLAPLELQLRNKIGVNFKVTDVKEIPKTLNDWKSNEWGSQLRDLRDKHVFNFGKASEVGIRYINPLEQ